MEEEELRLSEPEDPQVTQEELRHELDDLEVKNGPVQEQFSAPQMFLVESSSGNICIRNNRQGHRLRRVSQQV